MPKFEIRAGDDTQTVEADSWMTALGAGLAGFGLGSDALGRVLCDINEDGSILVQDPVHHRNFVVRELEEPGAAGPVQVRLHQASVQAEPSLQAQPGVSVRVAQADHAITLEQEELDKMIDAPDPRSSAAFEAASERGEDSLDELVELSAQIDQSSDASSASELALSLLMRFVAAESGAVLLLTPAGDQLAFVAAKGPRSAGVSGLKIPAKVGIAGVSVSSNMAMLVREAGRDARHFDGADKKTGYQTRALLAVPLRGPSGHTHGVLELLNPFGGAPFQEWHLDAAQMVGAKLASRLG